VHLVGSIIRIYHDALSPERQIMNKTFLCTDGTTKFNKPELHTYNNYIKWQTHIGT